MTRAFPFEGYVRSARKSGYFEMVRRVANWAGHQARVLDFGAGPCDKTALFELVGFNVTAFDTLEDAWHQLDDNQEKILEFADLLGIEYLLPSEDRPLPFLGEMFDVVMIHDVLEHWHSSPRVILNKLLGCLRSEGLLVITVPNAANLRKRLSILFGRTNYNRFEYFYWYPGTWKGHVREYVRDDLELVNTFLGLEQLELSSYSLQLDVLPSYLRRPFQLLTVIFPGFRDSWMLISRKPNGWTPRYEPTPAQFSSAFGDQYYNYSEAEFDWRS